jgi:Fic-DOC domain mobile mystery protein B
MLRQPPNVEQLLDEPYLRHFHRSMFNEVWRWAGTYRIRETNIGIEPSGIAIAVRNLVDDARAWVEYSTFDAHELAVRFHHRLVSIHPFPNGNGRHARIAADYLLSGLDGSQFSWGANLGLDTAGLRDKYLSALRSADRGDISDLVRFARS